MRVPLDTLLLILIFTDDEKRIENNSSSSGSGSGSGSGSSSRRAEVPEETYELAKRGAQVACLYARHADERLRRNGDTVSLYLTRGRVLFLSIRSLWNEHGALRRGSHRCHRV